MSKYEKQANDFAKKHGVTLNVVGEPQYKKHFATDKDYRWVFRMRLSRNKKSYTFNFGQSINDGSKVPTMYDVLTCLQKHDVGSFEDFCSEFGYNTDSKKDEHTYKLVCKEYEAMERLFGDVMEELQEIN